MTWERRVEAQRAIERVYHSHQIGTTLLFEEAVPEALLESKVRTSMQRSLALERYWMTPVTQEALRREMARFEAGTQLPARLRELYAALGNDAFLIQETLVRGVLVDRLTRSFFESDGRIHAAARARAEDLRRSLMRSRHKRDRGSPAEVVEMSPEAVDRRWRGQRRTSGAIGPLVEEPGRFVVEVVLGERGGKIRLARHAVAKTTWDQWWGLASRDLDPGQVHPVADPSAARRPVVVPVRTALDAQSLEPLCEGDAWQNGSLDDLLSPRWRHTAVWTGSLMIVWGGEPNAGSNMGSRYDPLTDTWASISTNGAPSARSGHSAVWTGAEMIVWGGGSLQNHLGTGGRYNPASDTWSPTSTQGAPAPRTSHTATWTGTLMVVWGGEGSGSSGRRDGGRYDPASDSWTPTSEVNAPEGRTGHTAIWTGDEVIIWGGYVNILSPPFDTGGRYDPDTDTWLQTSTVDAPSGRGGHSAVWTGTEMIVWGGWSAAYGAADEPYFDDLSDGGRYNPATDAWRPTSLIDAPDIRQEHSAVWTGAEMIVWGGVKIPCWDFCAEARDTGARYDPASDVWTPMSEVNAPAARDSHTAVWAGDRMIVWGGRLFSGVLFGFLNTGGRYDPAADSWTPTSTGSGPRGSGSSAVWTGTEMIVWGGVGFDSFVATGGRYDPALDAWSPTSPVGAPSPRFEHTGVWTGTEMIVWGGFSSSGRLGTGARYNPATDVWSALPTLNAPSPRTRHSAVLVGGGMIVWGGSASGATSGTNTGAIYDLAMNEWTPTTTAGAPLGRNLHGAVSTGSRMIVWGGFTPSAPPGTNTGGIYDPEMNTWSPTSVTGAPSPRTGLSAVWTGTEMIVWGGGSFTNTGGRYDPASDSWAPTALDGAPKGRGNHAAVWSGEVMIVWGGADNSSVLSTGGRYDPATDGWTPTTTVDAPVGRRRPAAVWSGTHMIVWGGRDEGEHTGGRYTFAQPVDDDGDGFTPCDGDCNDSDPDAYPGGLDLPGDLSDQDCSGTRLCDPEGAWRSHGAFVSCVSKKCELYMAAGLLTQEDCDALIRDAARSSVGR